MNIWAVLATVHIAATNHAAGVGFTLEPHAVEPVAARMPEWRAVQPKPVMMSDAWTARAIHHIPLRVMR